MHIHTSLLPCLTSREELAGRTVVVIDVLRATTTISFAIASGAVRVIPCLEPEDAVQYANGHPNCLTGGERGGVKIDGFDLSNSPADYTPEIVAGNTIAFTTTNGTRAMSLCELASRVLLGSFVGLSAVCDVLRTAKVVHLLCAGTNGRVTREDVLLAGAIACELASDADETPRCDETELAEATWRAVADEPLARELRNSVGGRNLVRLGFESDIEIAAAVNHLSVAAELNLGAWEIRGVAAS